MHKIISQDLGDGISNPYNKSLIDGLIIGMEQLNQSGAFLKYFTGMLVNQFAFTVEVETFAHPVKQRITQLFLKCTKLTANGLRCNMQQFSGTGDTAFTGDKVKVVKVMII